MVKIRVIKTRSNNMNDILITGNRTIDLRYNGIKKNIKLRKQVRRLEIIEKIKKYFKLLAVSLGVILVVGSNLNFKIDIAEAKNINLEEIILNSAEEQEMDNVIEEVIQSEENIKDYKEEFQEDIKQEILEKKKEVRKQEINKVENKKYIIHNEWSLEDERQDWINYAYKIWWKDFVLTILAENGTMWIDRKSGMVWANGYSDYWLCQINVWYHKDILSDWKNWKRFKDWFYNPYKQLDYCNKLFITGTRFYWYDVRHKVAHKIDIKAS